MGRLRFSFATMGSGKSTMALQIHHNLASRGLHGILCTARLIELADECEELQVETRCRCGERATQNVRVVDDVIVHDGDIVVVGDAGERLDEPITGVSVRYELLCRRHWRAGDIDRPALSGS